MTEQKKTIEMMDRLEELALRANGDNPADALFFQGYIKQFDAETLALVRRLMEQRNEAWRQCNQALAVAAELRAQRNELEGRIQKAAAVLAGWADSKPKGKEPPTWGSAHSWGLMMQQGVRQAIKALEALSDE